MTPKYAASKRDMLITEHLDVARNLARKMARRAGHLLSPEDIEAAAMLGLTEAAERYDDTRAEPFFAFAVKRVRGAILDELRRADALSRRERRRARAVAQVRADIELRLGRPANDNEVAHQSGLSIEEVERTRALPQSHAVPYDDERGSGQSDARDVMVAHVDRRRQLASLRAAIDELPARDRRILELYYDEALNLREIGERLGVSESRICQLRSRAERALQAALGAPAGGRRDVARA